MLKLPQKQVSLLKPDGFKPTYPALAEDLEVDVAIVGGGIAGLSAAYMLKKAGLKVAVLEKDAIGSGTTGHTTGKVTSQHNLMYADMLAAHGKETARLYGQANENAVGEIESIIKTEKIDCGWQRADNYVYTTDSAQLGKFVSEAKAATSLGLPASFEAHSPLPFEITAAVRFANQAHFSGQKYIEGLAKIINGNGSFIFENTKATGFKDGTPCIVEAGDHQIIANHVIVATNVPTLPLFARLSYCIFEYPTTSYLVAGKPKVKIEGMYISPDEGYYSILPVGDTLLVGGENHIPGLGLPKPRQQKLADFGAEHFGITKIDYRWGARDYLGYDGLPLVGKLYPWSKNMYVVTGFKKWGLSNSYVAATILRDLILGQESELAKIFYPHRLSLIKSIPRIMFS